MSSSSTTQMPRPEPTRLSLRDLCVMSMLGALMMGAQVAMASLPNIEPVTVLLMCTTLVYGRRAFYPCYVFVLLEGLVYGFGFWFINYLYVWAVLVGLVLALRRNTSCVFWTIIAAIYGLCFGALCAIPYFITGGWAAGFAYWVSGIYFDLLHCAGNAAMTGLLLRPLTAALRRLSGNISVSN